MDKFLSWFDLARNNFGTRNVFSTTPKKESIIDQLFFGVRASKIGAMGIYLELYEETPTKTISVYILTYSASYDQVSASFSAEKITLDIDKMSPFTTDIATPPFDGGHIFKGCLHLEFTTTPDLKTLLSSANARLTKDHEQAKKCRYFDLRMKDTAWPNKNRNVITRRAVFERFAKNAHALCPNCYGNGSTISMHIPKEDWESGASGYDLYASNKVSGREACEVCGGSGAKYLKWFLDEKPQHGSIRFKPGSGLKKLSSDVI